MALVDSLLHESFKLSLIAVTCIYAKYRIKYVKIDQRIASILNDSYTKQILGWNSRKCCELNDK